VLKKVEREEKNLNYKVMEGKGKSTYTIIAFS
jgi:hypothetical protein